MVGSQRGGCNNEIKRKLIVARSSIKKFEERMEEMC